jgi:acyl carrier protein
MRDDIRQRLKQIVVSGLRIQDLTAEEMKDEQALLGSGLDVDSIDMLQLILEIEKTFGIKLVSGQFDRSEWATIDTLAAAIEKRLETPAAS